MLYISDRVQTNLAYHCLLLLVCVSHASMSESTLDEIETLPEIKKYEDASTLGTAVQAYRFSLHGRIIFVKLFLYIIDIQSIKFEALERG